MRIFKLLALCVLLAVPTFAQVPNHESTVKAVYASQPWSFNTREEICAFVDAVVRALHVRDENWGHLKKNPNQNGCESPQGRHAGDVALWRPNGNTVDFLFDAGPGGTNRVVWKPNTGDNYPQDSWLEPGHESPMPEPIPMPVPTPSDPAPQPTPGGIVWDLESLRRQMRIEDKADQILLKLNAEVLVQLARIEAKVDEVGTSVKDVFAFLGKYVSPAVITALVTWWTTRDNNPETP